MADDDELTRLKSATADDRYEWMCPICMSPYDNQYRVPMAVSECYAKKRNPYSEEEDRGRADGCGHQVCEVCSLRMLEKHMQCAVCRSNIKEFAADTTLLAEIVAFADGQYVSMAAQYNEASTRLEPALMDLKKLQDDMAPAMKEAQEARERADKLQAEVNNLKFAAASRDMYQKLYQEEKEKSEAIPELKEQINKLQRDLYSLNQFSTCWSARAARPDPYRPPPRPPMSSPKNRPNRAPESRDSGSSPTATSSIPSSPPASVPLRTPSTSPRRPSLSIRLRARSSLSFSSCSTRTTGSSHFAAFSISFTVSRAFWRLSKSA